MVTECLEKVFNVYLNFIRIRLFGELYRMECTAAFNSVKHSIVLLLVASNSYKILENVLMLSAFPQFPNPVLYQIFALLLGGLYILSPFLIPNAL